MWGNGGWIKNILSYENYDPCKQLKLIFGPPLSSLLTDMGLDQQCPFKPVCKVNSYLNNLFNGFYVPKGFYHYKKNAVLDYSPWSMYYGKNRIIFKIFKPRKQLILTFVYTSTIQEVANTE